MPTYTISVINHTFAARNEHEMPSLDEAGKQGIKSALAIGSEEILEGKPFFAAEIRIEEGDETLSRFIVSVGATPIQ